MVLLPSAVVAQATDRELAVYLRECVNNGRWSDGLRIVERRADSEDPELLSLIARVQAQTLQPGEAIKTLDRARSVAPNDSALALQAAWALLQADDIPGAAKVAEKAGALQAEPVELRQVLEEIDLYSKVEAAKWTPPPEGTPAHAVWRAINAFDRVDLETLRTTLAPQVWEQLFKESDSAQTGAYMKGLRTGVWQGWGNPSERRLWLDPNVQLGDQQTRVNLYTRQAWRPDNKEPVKVLRQARVNPATAALLDPSLRSVLAGLSDVDLEVFLTRYPYAPAPMLRLQVLLKVVGPNTWVIEDLQRADGASVLQLGQRLAHNVRQAEPVSKGIEAKDLAWAAAVVVIIVRLARRKLKST